MSPKHVTMSKPSSLFFPLAASFHLPKQGKLGREVRQRIPEQDRLCLNNNPVHGGGTEEQERMETNMTQFVRSHQDPLPL